MTTYDILIVSIPHRHELLCQLLAELGRQLTAWTDVQVRLYRDNLETSYGAKTRALLKASTADYVSCIDDDDMVAPDYIDRVCAALDTHPDYVGFPVRWTIDGEPQIPVMHSLRHHGWVDTPQWLIRDFVQFNPIRRELALLGDWDGGWGADRGWSDGVRARVAEQKLQLREAWIDEPMYYYQDARGDNFSTQRGPLPAQLIQPLPVYPWLVTRDET